MSDTSANTQRANALAVGLSGLCILHCLAVPILVSMTPMLGLLAEEWIHKTLVVMTIPVSLFVLSRNTGTTDRLILMGLIAVGSILLLLGAFVESLHDFETQLTVSGALVLSLTHATRWWLHRRAA
ncbi:MAG: MerC domain-containing protein [Pseudomonadota bacterium]